MLSRVRHATDRLLPLHARAHLAVQRLSAVTSLAAAVLLFGCSGENAKARRAGSATPPDGSLSGTGGKSSEGDASEPYARLIDGAWSLQPGEEKKNVCITKVLTDDVYIHAIRALQPAGTHHTVLTISKGANDCLTSVVEGAVYVAAVGSNGITMPEGVAMKLPAGSTLGLSLHIFNTTMTPLTGLSGMDVITMKSDDVKALADAYLTGPTSFSLPPHQVTRVSSDCIADAEQQAFALFPHMHQLGTHIKTTVISAGATQVLHDAAFAFNEQLQIPLSPNLSLHPGDTLHTECTYENTTDRVVTFGESTDTEMCISAFYRFPAQPSTFCPGTANVDAVQ